MGVLARLPPARGLSPPHALAVGAACVSVAAAAPDSKGEAGDAATLGTGRWRRLGPFASQIQPLFTWDSLVGS